MTEVGPSPSKADHSLLRAIRAWGAGDFVRFSSRLSDDWRDRLRSSWASMSREKPDEAWASLRFDHEGSARHDPSRVHPSWFVRALQNESMAVRIAVASHCPEPVRESLRRGLGIDPAQLRTDHAPDREAIDWALALWSERVVGDVPDIEVEAPVVVALTRLGARDLARLIRVCGVVKHAFAIEGAGPDQSDESIARFTPLDRVRLGFFRRHIGVADARLVPLARFDLQSMAGDWRRAHGRVGLVTFGRLLASVEPHRARWALQHIPYPVAKLMRIPPLPSISSKALEAWESWVLEAAWARLFSEGRLAGGRTSWAEISEGAPS